MLGRTRHHTGCESGNRYVPDAPTGNGELALLSEDTDGRPGEVNRGASQGISDKPARFGRAATSFPGAFAPARVRPVPRVVRSSAPFPQTRSTRTHDFEIRNRRYPRTGTGPTS